MLNKVSIQKLVVSNDGTMIPEDTDPTPNPGDDNGESPDPTL